MQPGELSRSYWRDPALEAEAAVASGFVLPVGTVTFLLTDVAGSTRLWQDDPEQAASAIAAHYEVIDDAVARHGGVRPQEQGEGDSTVTAFARASDAVAAALDVQRVLAADPGTAELRVRAALHTGEALLRDEGNYFGEAVNRCARLRAIAHGGQIVLSQVTSELTRDRLPDAAALVDLGVHRLRDLARPEHVFMLTHPDIAAEFPPLVSLDAFAHNLPIQLTSFITRDADVAAIKDLLADHRLVTLTGSGGCGKTRLGLQVAADLVDSFPDGVWFVDLAPLQDPEGVAGQALTALGLQEGPMQSSIDALRAYLARRRALLVLDNCEHLIDACARLSESVLSSCPDAWILSTSREPLGIAGEVTWRVPSLAVPTADVARDAPESLAQFDAVRLFVERALAVRPNFQVDNDNAPAVAEICSRLEGIPLAIELAAARVRLMPPHEILDALGDHLRLLTGGGRTARPRQKTLEASVAWSFELLTPADQAVFARLSVFAGSFSLDAGEKVCGFDPISAYEVLDIVSSLVDKSLVQVETEDSHGRYRLLETIRQFAARELLSHEETNQLRASHARFFLEALLANRAALDAGDFEPVAWFERDFDNIRAAMESVLSTSDLSLVLRAAWPLSVGAIVTGRGSETRSWIEAVLDVETDDTRARADALLGLGSLLWARLEIATAVSLGEEALAIYRHLENDFGIGRAAAVVGFCLQAMGDASASEMIDEAVAKGRATSDPLTIIYGGFGLAWHEMFTDVAASQAHVRQTIESLGSGEWPFVRGLLLDCLAVTYVMQGRWHEACQCSDQAVGVAESYRRGMALPWALSDRGEAMLHLGRLDHARQDLEAAKRICEESQEVVIYQAVLGVLAELELECGNLDLARTYAEQGVAMAMAMAPQVQGLTQVKLARVLMAQADKHAAHECVDRIIDLGRTFRFQWALATALCLKGRLVLAEGDLPAAEGLVAEALRIFQEARSISGTVECVETLGEIAGRLESWSEAARLISCAQSLRDQTGFVLPAKDPDVFDPLLEGLRDNLGDDFDRVWAEGAALDLDGVVEYATRGRGERKRPSSGWASLTPTELQVADLVSEGLTNPQIGERLFISKRTVQGHVSRILMKLSLSSRSEIAAHVAKRAASEER